MNNLSCWWKNGKAYPLDDPYNQTHLEYVLKHLDVFGFDDDWINRLVKESGEIITEEDGDFTEGAEALKENLLYYGWIRVRHWSTNFEIECWDSNSKDLKDCVWYLYQEYKKSGDKRFSVDVESVKGKGGAYYESEIDYKFGGRPLTELLSSRQIKSNTYNDCNVSCWWKDGNRIDVDYDFHLDVVEEYPEKFGFTRESLDEWENEHGVLIDDDCCENFEFLDKMENDGWIRVRHYDNEVVVCGDSDSKDFKDCCWWVYETLKKNNIEHITINDYNEDNGELVELLSSKYSLTEQEIINSLIK